MGFMHIPSRLHYGSKDIVDFYEGVGNDSGYWLFKMPNDKYIMRYGELSFTFTDTSSSPIDNLQYAGVEVGGEPGYQGPNGTWKMYYVPSFAKWIIIRNAPYWGYIPSASAYADSDYDTGVTTFTYTGDLWWECSTINTMPYDGQTVGNFTFALRGYTSDYPDLQQYANMTHNLTGDISQPYYKIKSGNGPTGVYDNDKYVGYPEWIYRYNGTNKYLTHYGDSNYDWQGLQRYSINRIEGRDLNDSWTGWVAIDTLGAPNADTTKGFYAWIGDNPRNPPEPESDITFKWYHFVPDDPDDPESAGDIVQDNSYVDDRGVSHSMPDIEVTWRKYTTPVSTHVPRLRIIGKLAMCEAAIWR